MKFKVENEPTNENAAPTPEYRIRELRASLEQRLDRLEQVQRREGGRRWIGPVLGASALVMLFTMTVRSRNVVRTGSVASSLAAGSFRLEDADGVQRATLGLGDDGGASLTLSDENGHARLRLSVLADGSPGVSLLDTDGETRAILGLLADGTTTLVLADGGSVARAIFALTPDGAARVIFNDRDGQTRTAVGVDTEGKPEVSTIDVARAQPPARSESAGSGSLSDSKHGGGLF
jgi:hypothetical protein